MAQNHHSHTSLMSLETPKSNAEDKSNPRHDQVIVSVLDTLNVVSPATKSSQGLERNVFSPWTAFGLAFSVINSWMVLVVGLGSGLVSGGPSALVWGFVYASICNLATVLSHCEVFAVFPTAAGQYHWAAILSPPRIKNALSWVTGMLNVVGLWLGGATAGYLATVLLAAAIQVNLSDFVLTAPKQYGIFAAILFFGPSITLGLGVHGNRLLDQGLMVLSVLAALAIVITLPATTENKASVSFVFGGINNMTGWNSMVIAWLLGLLQSAFAYLGFDIVYHISEEMPNPRVEGPKAVIGTICASAVAGIAVLLAMLFCISDLESVVSTSYLLPFAQICMDSTGSRAATTILLLVPSILFMNTVRGIVITASRVLLALGRDDVLPYRNLWLITFRGEPLYGMLLSVAVPLICGLVQLGSSSTFNSLLGAATIVFELSYAIPPVLMLLGGRRKLNQTAPSRTSNLGRWGIPCNLLSIFFVVQSCIIYCFPGTMPVTAGNMSYVVVFLGGFAVLMSIIWFGWSGKRYRAPTEEAILELINKRSDESPQ